jgi:hypothetical protein
MVAGMKQITLSKALTPAEIDKFQRMMRNAKPTVLLILLLRLDRPVQVKEAAAITGVNRDTASDYLYYLAQHGYVAKTTEGYILTEGGRQMVLPGTMELRDPELSGKFPHASLEEDSILKTQLIDSSSETPMRKNSALTTKDILEKSGLAFGNPVFTTGIDLAGTDPAVALGWMAQAKDSKKVQQPWALVYRRLKDPSRPQPEPKYMKDPERYLPDNYLEALGILITLASNDAPDDAQRDPHAEDGDADPAGSGTSKPDDTTAALVQDGGRITADQAWQLAKGQLEMEMSRGTFDAQLSQAELLHYQDGKFTIGTEGDHARDWCESRVTSTVRRLLMGISNRTVEVEWVTK